MGQQRPIRQWHQVTVVVTGQEVNRWVEPFQEGRTRGLWNLLLELVETTGGHSPGVDARGDPVAFEWILPGVLRDGPPWGPTPTGAEGLMLCSNRAGGAGLALITSKEADGGRDRN